MTLQDICYKPLGKACAIESVLQYWQMSEGIYEHGLPGQVCWPCLFMASDLFTESFTLASHSYAGFADFIRTPQKDDSGHVALHGNEVFSAGSGELCIASKLLDRLGMQTGNCAYISMCVFFMKVRAHGRMVSGCSFRLPARDRLTTS